RFDVGLEQRAVPHRHLGTAGNQHAQREVPGLSRHQVWMDLVIAVVEPRLHDAVDVGAHRRDVDPARGDVVTVAADGARDLAPMPQKFCTQHGNYLWLMARAPGVTWWNLACGSLPRHCPSRTWRWSLRRAGW